MRNVTFHPFLVAALAAIANLLFIAGCGDNQARSRPPRLSPTPTPARTMAILYGVFDLVAAGKQISAAALSNPSVDGISIRQHWDELNPSEGVFDFSYLDSQVAVAAGADKKILLRIGDGRESIPQWVREGVQTFFTFTNDGQTVSIPVFWDGYYLQKKTAMIAAVGAHFTDNLAIQIASCGIANANSDDWAVPHEPDEVTNWKSVGYTSQKLIDSCDAIIDAMMNAWPNQAVVIAINPNGKLDQSANYVPSTVVANSRAKWGDRLVVGKNSLSAKTPIAPGDGSWKVLYDARPDVAGQMLWNCYNDTSYRMNGGIADDPATILRKAVDTGTGYGMSYLEIYETDIVHLPSVIDYAHSKL